MRKIAVLIVAAAGVSLAGAASAADMARPVYTKAPMAPAYLWQGSYIGGYIGGATGADNMTTGVPVTGAGAPIFAGAGASYKYGSSFIGGYTGGYNWQVSPNWVLGYESETGYIGVTGASTFAGSATSTARTSIGGLYSTWTARVGYAWDRSLLYVKGGAALATVQTGVTDPTAGAHIDTTGRKYALGYAAGAGYEYALDNKWSIKAEYMYLGFDKNITTTGNFTAVPVQVFTTTSLAGLHTGKVGLNYKWDWLSLLK
jgi:outer membrane immunogenic protein